MALAVLWLLFTTAWWLMLRLLDPLLERSRDALLQDRIVRGHQAWERQRQLMARERHTRRLRVVELDGEVRWLAPEEIPGFLRRCWRELDLAEGSSWTQIRQQWRRHSLRWHPDHGGDPAIWLRKQRAYEALKWARSDARPVNVGRAAGPRPISPGRRRFPWRDRRGG